MTLIQRYLFRQISLPVVAACAALAGIGILSQSLDQLEVIVERGQSVWVMGGAQIYAQALPLADVVEVTLIHQDFEGDAYAPTLGAEWQVAHREDHVSAKGLPFSFVRYERQR